MILSALAILVAIVTLSLLVTWTRSLEREADISALREALRETISEGGERAVLEMAGIPVEEIHYSYEDIPLYKGERGAWNLSEEDRRGVSLYRKAAPSVVEIISAKEGSGNGAGVILSSDGYIVTNHHVAGSGKEFTVRFHDGSEAVARLVGSDALSDVAVLKADVTGLTPITAGSAHSVSVGENVYAIGHPYGFSYSLSRGIISGLGRTVEGPRYGVIPGMIQTDALINPGNSGGPLLSADGRMIGLISSIYSTSGSAEGVAFALPVETVIDVARSIIETGRVHRGWLDVLAVVLNPAIAEYASLPVDEGILISQAVPGGEADKGGLKGGTEATQYGQSVIYLGGDVITAINGVPMRGWNDYFAFFFSSHAGDEVTVTVLRGGESVDISGVILIEQDESNIRWIAR